MSSPQSLRSVSIAAETPDLCLATFDLKQFDIMHLWLQISLGASWLAMTHLDSLPGPRPVSRLLVCKDLRQPPDAPAILCQTGEATSTSAPHISKYRRRADE